MAEIIVAIPTFKRPESLKRLLIALETLETQHRVIVVVADNDAEDRQGYDLCRKLSLSYRWPLDPILTPERGIAQVRNSLVVRALSYPAATYIAMLDDDEWPSAQWLDELVRVQAETGAAVVEGSILFETGEGAPDFQPGFDGVSSMRRPTGPTPMLEGAGNILITRACLEAMLAPWFDPDFALTGGEDRDFFERVKASGGHFAWSDEALAYTSVPALRQNLGWVLRRAYGIGNTEMRIFLKYRPTLAARLRECAKVVVALFAMPVIGLATTHSPRRSAEAWRRFYRNMGKLAALAGHVHQPYAVTHGD
ncbi:glycosyltransferase involved in cell wall biosynthesis [Rhizomicrobium palustre]|uniref:Glycosyltransferase involved in cell wall biosynthesis n=1 Tax=Rhizomicrobium palustre TaxID=189966 RepID=A0A846MZ18_9PROT|nr:glycosyltransferase involved in cell wall biosynthesis [Rhizomicrobium palustre]